MLMKLRAFLHHIVDVVVDFIEEKLALITGRLLQA